ncbi:MAG: hypothetical protein OXF50_13295 [Caldilineaceae bacterium]|nr:hypothetical protein [Caldilineaceae bacterium]
MKQDFSISTIRKPDAYSVGVSLLDYIALWDQSRFQEKTSGGDELGHDMALNLTADDSTSACIVRQESTGFQPGEREWAIILFCHYLVDRIPEEGLIELAESLASIYSFYQTRSLPTQSLLPRATRVSAVVRDTIEPPPFELELSEG